MPNKYLGFLEDVKHLDWRISESGKIRTDKDECPICAYVNVKHVTDEFFTYNVWDALSVIRDSFYQQEVLMFTRAADGANTALRQEILTRLNLTEHANE
jgi:hypothetical protein